MAEYKFITYWKINTRKEEVWELIKNVSSWPDWWPGVLDVHQIQNVGDGEHSPRFAHTWQSFLPYKLKFVTEITEIVIYKSIEAKVIGELEGKGLWEFKEEEFGNTTVVYKWHVRTTLTWMNISAPFLSGVFRRNHDTIMRWGGEGIAKKLNCRVMFRSEQLH